MLGTLQDIVQQVNAAVSLDEAVTIVVRRVKQAMVADACSVFVRDSTTDQYVLMASEGLNPEAVGKVRLAANEGIVGLVATRQKTINLENAADHPNYRYFPETGEERYCGFLGVPLVHFRRALGVLVVQQRQRRVFDKNEVAFLVTIGAQLAGALNYVATGSALPLTGSAPTISAGLIQGLPAAPGVTIGTIVLPSPFTDLESVADCKPQDTVVEEATFRQAVRRVQDALRESADRIAHQLSSEAQAIFDVYILILGQESLVDEVVTRIRGGNWAPGALRDAITERAQVLEQADDPYLRARAEDVRAIGRRILLSLLSDVRERRDYPKGTVLVGDEVGLARIAEIPSGRLAGIVCLRGSVVSHTAILARALGIPAVMGLGRRNIASLEGRRIIVDGYQGRVFVDPPPAVIHQYERLAREEAELSVRLLNLRDLPAVTTDGVRVSLGANISLLTDIDIAQKHGIDEVGLYRTEFPFMMRDAFPMEEDQYRVYRTILESFAPQPVIMRTLDVGGDKPLPYYPMREENPFLGWRGIRFTLDRPEVFIPQLRAMLRANVGLNNLRIMFPMISQVDEIKAARQALERAQRELSEKGQQCVVPPVGAMVEVPSAVFVLSALARYVEFFSVGTNDLTQYLLAVDRNNPNVASLYESIDPAVLRALCAIVREARRRGKPVSVCGEMAADPAAAILLLGAGIERLSMSASALPRIKWVIRSFSSARAKQILGKALHMESAKSIRQMLSAELEQAGLGDLIRVGT